MVKQNVKPRLIPSLAKCECSEGKTLIPSDHKILYPPSERSETGGYIVFTCMYVCVSVRPSVHTQYSGANISKTFEIEA